MTTPADVEFAPTLLTLLREAPEYAQLTRADWDQVTAAMPLIVRLHRREALTGDEEQVVADAVERLAVAADSDEVFFRYLFTVDLAITRPTWSADQIAQAVALAVDIHSMATQDAPRRALAGALRDQLTQLQGEARVAPEDRAEIGRLLAESATLVNGDAPPAADLRAQAQGVADRLARRPIR